MAIAASSDPCWPQAATGSASGGDPGGDLLAWCAGDPPARIGQVRLIRLIGKGGMGDVYLGRHDVLGTDVAVKLMRPDRVDPVRFAVEAQLAARVRHEHVVAIHDAGSDQGRFYLVLEHLPGPDLQRFVQHVGPLGWRKAVDLIIQAACGLGAAHAAGIVHRDVKPGNLILDGGGRVKVADLGLARLLGDRDPSTVTGDVLGTPGYMAPEQAFDPRSVDARADVYGLGATLWFLLTGSLPPLADQRTPLPAGTPPALTELLDRMLARQPRRRPLDGAAVARALDGIRHCPLRARATRRRAALAAAVVVLVLAGLVWLLLARGSAPPPRPITLVSVVAAAPAVAAATPPLPPAAPAPATSARPEPVALVAPAAEAPRAGWSTPERAAFLIDEALPAEALAPMHQALFASGLRVVERRGLEAILAELRRAGETVTDQGTALRIGHLVSGHVAILGRVVSGQVELRVVAIESGELCHYRLVPSDQTGAATVTGIARAVAALPVQCRVSAGTLDAGARHGVRVGDRFALHGGTPAAPGPVLAVVAVSTVAEDSARLAPEVSAPGATLARKLLR